MIIVQTPLRISFFGGGTDFEDFYSIHGGAVLSSAIDKYVFVIVKGRFDDKVYVNYSQKEIVDSVDDLQHGLVREAMKKTGVSKGIEITTLADIPSEGTGLGSSSSLIVGLLQALYAYQGEIRTAADLAEEACQIEIDVLGRPIGKQDQYIAAFGDVRFISFNGGETIQTERIMLNENGARFVDSLMLFYTGRTRKADSILTEQKANIGSRTEVLCQMRELAFKGKELLLSGDFDEFGRTLHQGWELKKELASSITDSQIDSIYELAREAGAVGGKISGAGGGGFLLLYCPRSRQEDVRLALRSFRELDFHFERDGCKVIFNYRRAH